MKGLTCKGAQAVAPWTALALALLAAAAAPAQSLNDRPVPPPADNAGLPGVDNKNDVSFAADALDYDQDADIVSASGDVLMLRDGNRLRADKVVWNRKTGAVTASGNVAVINPGGDIAYGDKAMLDEDVRNGIIENLLLVLNDGGRLAARKGTRKDNIAILEHAAYTPCRVATDSNCPRESSWKITAIRIVHDDKRHRIYYKDTRFHLFGVPVLWLPAFSHPDGSDTAQGVGGLLLPDVQISKANGVEAALPFYWKLAPNRDATITPHLYTKILPALEAQYRQLDSHGAFQVRGMATYGSKLPATVNSNIADKNRAFRGFIDANGRYQFGPNWTVSGQLRLETDRTFMKRYDINADDRLRSTIEALRLDNDSMLSIAGWYVQTVRVGETQGQQPMALPAIDYRRRLKDPFLGGVVQLQANTLGLIRTAGQDTQRVFSSAQWDLRRITGMGQEVTFTALARADGYHTDDVTSTTTASYRGLPGWHGRGVVAAAADIRWPFIGQLWGGLQQIAPRVQLVATPPVRNLSIPNEDSRAVDLDDVSIFSINRFPGYDRWEDASRITYGVEWNYQRPRFEAHATLGQSYRFSSEPTILPDGTGLTNRFSDYVGRVTLKYGSWITLTERFRLDKDHFAVRRDEFDATIGSKKTYILVGYLLLNRNIDTRIEDLRDRQEVRLGARVQLARYWSIFGSTVLDLTTQRQDPLSLSNGFQPVRNRVGLTYEDECIAIGVTWRQDFDPIGDARRGSTFALRLALKNIGR